MTQPTESNSKTTVIAAVAVALLVVVGGLIFLSTQDGGTDTGLRQSAPPVATPEQSPEASGPATDPPAAVPPVATPSETPVSVEGCTFTPAGPASRPVELPTEPAPASANVSLDTAFGTVQLRLDGEAAPCATASFLSLAEQGFFDDTACHRLVTGGIMVLQCGDPDGSGRGGPGYTFPDENLDGATYPPGTVAMANSGLDTNGSQFFLVFGDTPLPPSYTPFGQITEGLPEIQALAEQGSTPATDGAPNGDASIRTVTQG